MKFYSNQIKACSKCLNSLFQNQCRLIPFSPFFQRITSHISLDLLGVSLHRMFVSFSSAMIGKNFSNLYCSYYWKMHLWISTFLLMPLPQVKLSLRFLSPVEVTNYKLNFLSTNIFTIDGWYGLKCVYVPHHKHSNMIKHSNMTKIIQT